VPTATHGRADGVVREAAQRSPFPPTPITEHAPAGHRRLARRSARYLPERQTRARAEAGRAAGAAWLNASSKILHDYPTILIHSSRDPPDGDLCPGYDRGCYGCFGPAKGANVSTMVQHLHSLGMPGETTDRMLHTFNAWAPAFRGDVPARTAD
jgi:hypothetical protein